MSDWPDQAPDRRPHSFCMSSTSAPAPHCTVPIYSDPGVGTQQARNAKFAWYLVTGREVEAPGAYTAWGSADAQYKKVSGATVKGYAREDWPLLEAAWQAACGRDHQHLTPAPTSAPRMASPRFNRSTPARGHSSPGRAHNSAPPPRTTPSPPLRTFVIESRSPSPVAHTRVYAVRTGVDGDVFDNEGDAKAQYIALQRRGLRPVLGVRRSVSEALIFIATGEDDELSQSMSASLTLAGQSD
ncbi:hypothetical protein C8R43DRAFT_1116772 [Mycena crocata]|nr:hypothetical protein C8R43DRAFT_1116772 [Mycena crocata]